MTSKSGAPVTGLQQRDFTILDNKVPQTITSFEAVEGTQAPTQIIVVIDAVNAEYHTVSYARDQIDRFLREDEGDLSYPTALFVLTDTGVQPLTDYASKDGNKLRAALDQYTVAARFLRRNAGFYGAAERFQISLGGLHQLVGREALLPGRKLMLWISPGWPLLSGPEVQLDDHERQQLFSDIVNLSTELRRGRITLYSIDPVGMLDSLARDTYWENFVNGVKKPGDAQAGHLGLEVLAVESGGSVYSFDNNITALLQRCVADARAYYAISFKPPAGTRPNEYHNLKIRVTQHGLTARTWQGYYSNPETQFGQPAIPPPVDVGTAPQGLR